MILRRYVRGITDLYRICCYLYCNFYIYAYHWIILSYTTLFIYWMFIWIITYLYPLKVCGISFTRFKDFMMFWTCPFVDLPLTGTNNFWRVRGLIDGFNESRRQIDYGVERRQTSRWVPYNFVPPLRDIYNTTTIFLGRRSYWGQRWRIWRALGWGQYYT